jgi:hypothetical protein
MADAINTNLLGRGFAGNRCSHRFFLGKGMRGGGKQLGQIKWHGWWNKISAAARMESEGKL